MPNLLLLRRLELLLVPSCCLKMPNPLLLRRLELLLVPSCCLKIPNLHSSRPP